MRCVAGEGEGEAIGLTHESMNLGCRWIEGDDFIERMRRGKMIYCGRPVATVGGSWCAEHRARVYIGAESPKPETETNERAAGDQTRDIAA